MRADAFGPAAVTRLAQQAPRRSLHRGDATGIALASTAETEVRRFAQGIETGNSRHRAGCCLAGAAG